MSGRPEERSREYRESIIDPQVELSQSRHSNVMHRYQSSAGSPSQARHHHSTCHTCGNMVEQRASQKMQKRDQEGRHTASGIMDTGETSKASIRVLRLLKQLDK